MSNIPAMVRIHVTPSKIPSQNILTLFVTKLSGKIWLDGQHLMPLKDLMKDNGIKKSPHSNADQQRINHGRCFVHSAGTHSNAIVPNGFGPEEYNKQRDQDQQGHDHFYKGNSEFSCEDPFLNPSVAGHTQC